MTRGRAAITLLVALVVAAFLALGMSAPAHATDPGTLMVRVTDQSGEYLTGLDNPANPADLAIVAVPVVAHQPVQSGNVAGVAVSGVPGEYSFSLVAGQDYAIVIPGATGTVAEIYSSAGAAAVSDYEYGYFDAADLVSVAADATSYLDFSVVSSVTLKGTLTNSSGKGASGVNVEAYRFDGSDWIDWQHGTSSSSGSYSLKGLDPGSYKLEFTDYTTTGYLDQFSGGATTLAAATSVYVGVGGSATVNAKLATGGKITGKVNFVDPDEATSSNPTGTFAANYVLPFAYRLMPDGSGGFAGVDKTVYYFGADTGSTGTWTVAGLPTGTYIVKLNDDAAPSSESLVNAYVGASGPVSNADSAEKFAVTAGHTTTTGVTTTLQLVPAAADAPTPLTLTVKAPGGAPLQNAFVTFTSNDDNDYSFSSGSTSPALLTDSNGEVVFERAPAGEYTVTADYSSLHNYGTSSYTPTYQPLVQSYSYNGTATAFSVTMANLDALGFDDAPAITDDTTLTAGIQHTASATANQDGATISYEWERDGKPIYGADGPDYTPQGGDIGHVVSALFTLAKDGFAPITQSLTLGTITTGPQITGVTPSSVYSSTFTPVPGSTLTPVESTWAVGGNPLTGVSTTVTWYGVGGSYGSGTILGTSPTLVAPLAAANEQIYAELVASKPGYVSSSPIQGNPILISPLAAPKLTKAASVTSKKLPDGSTQYTTTSGSWSLTGLTFTYQWQANGVNETEANSYTASAGSSADVYVTVTAVKTGYAPGTDRVRAAKGTVAPVTDPMATVQNDATSTLVGSNTPVYVGDLLNGAEPATTWAYADDTASAANTYQWYRQTGTATPVKISKATASTYTVTSSDVGHTLTVKESSTDTDYPIATATVSAGIGTTNPALVDANPSVSVAGSNIPGSPIGTSFGGFTVSNVTIAYQWYLCTPATESATSKSCTDTTTATDFGAGKLYAPISAATKSVYQTSHSQAGETLVIKVTASKAGYATWVGFSGHELLAASDQPITALTEPSIPGVAPVGATLKATPGTFDVTGVTLHYQWKICDLSETSCDDQDNWFLANGTTSTSSSYKVATADYRSGTTELEVFGWATKSGYASSRSLFSNPSVIALGTVTRTTKASITTKSGSFTVKRPTYSPAGGAVNYAWYVSGHGESDTSPVWTRTSADAGKLIQVVVGYVPNASLHYDTNVDTLVVQKGVAPGVLGTNFVKIVPTINPTFDPLYGYSLELSGNPFDYAIAPDVTSTLSYQWYANGTSIKGATSATFTPPAADIGKVITVKETATNPEWNTASFTSAGVTILGGGAVNAISPPTITGSPAVGASLGAATGTWNVSGLTFHYQWRVAGLDVPGATASTFTPLASDFGDDVSVTVTGSRAGYGSASQSSPAESIGLGTIPAATTLPKITGTLTGGQPLTVSPGGWKVDGLTYSYQWLADGSPILGASQSTYTPTGSATFTVIVTAARSGYAETTAQSKSVVATVGP